MNTSKIVHCTTSEKTLFVKLSEIAEKIMQEEFFLKETEKVSAVDCGGSATLMATGLEALDCLLTSFEPGDLYVIGSRPSMGKTVLLIQIALNIAASTQKPVYIHSLEMPGDQMVREMITQMTGIDQRNEYLSNEQKERMYLCWSMMDAMSIYICDTMETVDEIRRWFAKNEAEEGILLIDYLQLLHVDRNRHYADIITAIFEGLRALRQLAQEKNMPIIVGSQLTRRLEYRLDKRPRLQDLRESDLIEKEIDGVIFIYRDSYYLNDDGDDAELILAKNPNGETGTAYVKFNRNTLMFENK